MHNASAWLGVLVVEPRRMGKCPPSVVGRMVWVAGGSPPCMAVGVMWVVGALPPCVVAGTMCVEGPLPPCVTTGPAWLVTIGGGN